MRHRCCQCAILEAAPSGLCRQPTEHGSDGGALHDGIRVTETIYQRTCHRLVEAVPLKGVVACLYHVAVGVVAVLLLRAVGLVEALQAVVDRVIRHRPCVELVGEVAVNVVAVAQVETTLTAAPSVLARLYQNYKPISFGSILYSSSPMSVGWHPLSNNCLTSS